MRNITSIFCVLTGIIFAQIPSATIADSVKETTKLSKITKSPVYRPPFRGAPESRIGGGSRGSGDSRPQLTVLSPNHTGLTTMASPRLYWHTYNASQYPLEITIVNEQTLSTVLEVRLPKSGNTGTHHINLVEHEVVLEPEIEYRWFVTLIPDENQRSKDIISSATIKRVIASDALKSILAKNKQNDHPAIHAGEGIWYDAIDQLSRMINVKPDNSTAIQQRSALLEQVGIKLQ